MREYLLTLFVAAACTYLTVGMIRAVAIRFRVLAEIRDRDVHDTPIPRLGGVGMLLGLLAALLVASKLPLLRSVFGTDGDVRGVVIGALVITGVGVVDDVWGLDAITKLAGQTLAAGLMALQGVQLFWLPLPGQTLVLDSTSGTLLTILVVVVTINAVNFVDGLDGLAAGVIGIAASAFFLYSYVFSVQHDVQRAVTPSLLSAALVGMCAGFLVHNFSPARIFMGDSGSMLIGLLLASSTLTLTGRVDFGGGVGGGGVGGLERLPTLLPLLVPLAVLGVPAVDMGLAIVRRTRAGRSPFAPDKQHLHHRLLELGHSQRRAVLIMYGWTALVAYGAVGLAVLPVGVAGVLIMTGLVVLVLLVSWPWLQGARRPSGSLLP